MTTIKTPVGGLCLPLSWYKRHQYSNGLYEAQVCPDQLCIWTSVLGGNTCGISVNLAGRGLADAASCGADVYVSSLSGSEVPDGGPFDDVILIDVWQAYRDGIWTSSTTVVVAVACATSGAARTLTAQPRNNNAVAVTKSISPQVTGFCPSTTLATVTINDDGTFSIA